MLKFLYRYTNVMQLQFDFQAKSQQINDIEINIQKLAHNSGTWNEFKKKIDIKQHDLQLQKRQLEMTKYYELQEEIKNLQQNIGK